MTTTTPSGISSPGWLELYVAEDGLTSDLSPPIPRVLSPGITDKHPTLCQPSHIPSLISFLCHQSLWHLILVYALPEKNSLAYYLFTFFWSLPESYGLEYYDCNFTATHPRGLS